MSGVMSPMETLAQAPLRWSTPESIKHPPYDKFLQLLKVAVAAEPDRADLKLQLATILFHANKLPEIFLTYSMRRLGRNQDSPHSSSLWNNFLITKRLDNQKYYFLIR